MIRINCLFQSEAIEDYKMTLAAAVELTMRSRKHDGCISYDVFQSATRCDVFMICETWADQASLDSHYFTSVFTRSVRRPCSDMKFGICIPKC